MVRHRRSYTREFKVEAVRCLLPAARCLLPAAYPVARGLLFTRPFASCYKGHRSDKQSGPLGPDYDLPLRELLKA